MNKTILATMIGLAVLTGCDGSDNKNYAEVVTPPGEAEAFKSPYTVFLEGIGEGTLTKAASFTLEGTTDELSSLEITGATAVESAATKATSDTTKVTYTTDTGSFILTRTDASPTTAILLDLVVTADGYFTGGTQVTMPADADVPEGSTVFGVVTLSPQVVDNSGESTTAATGSTETVAVGDDGATTEAIVIATPVPDEDANNAAAVASGTVNVDMPAGTKMMTADGEPVTGPVEANVVYFSNEPSGSTDTTTDSVLLAFPGGLAPSSILDEDGEATTDDVSFVTAGFTAIEMRTESGDLITNFDPAITLNFEVPAATLSADGDPIETGDIIPVWSYNEQDGQWKSQGEEQIGEFNADANTYSVAAQIDHLSYFSLAYLETNCPAPTITLVDGTSESYQSDIVLTRNGGGWTQRYLENFGAITLAKVPTKAEGEVYISKYRSEDPVSLITEATDADGNALTVTDGTLQDQNFCALDGATITLEGVGAVADIDYSLALQSTCSDTDDVTPQTGLVTIYRVIGGINYALSTFTVDAGSSQTLTLEPGTYFVEGLLNGEVQGESSASETVVLTGDELVVDATLDFNAGSCITTGGSGGGGGN
ncbi:hypothetical protein BCU68_09095 [Vibrio sp. 10N.286.49.B3]|uniref:hypothetical protein n=1 Tax=Vibrio sp. 10N.286.49.B3 TaxID=1880855 RepID=UPI000C83CB75|nr:hypothetical protein [Vibrio sp. 10N.286.49.B3]PMH45941.1 hypothetical protein BCU68_09095 [Vibrio sp. 10N.286.49.B3]